MNNKMTTNINTFPMVNGKLPVAGSRVSWAGYNWLVADVDNYTSGVMYLVLDTIYSVTEFGNTDDYINSKLVSDATDFQHTLPDMVLSMLSDVTVKEITCKVFVPTYEMVNGGFEWFNNATNRIAKYNGIATVWWTSSAGSSGRVYCVNTVGDLCYGNPCNRRGFRPCVAMDIHPTDNILYV